MFYFNKLCVEEESYYLQHFAKCEKEYIVNTKEELESFIREIFDSSFLMFDSFYLMVCKNAKNKVIGVTRLFWVDGDLDLRQILTVSLLSNARIIDFVFVPVFNKNAILDFRRLRPLFQEVSINIGNVIDLEGDT